MATVWVLFFQQHVLTSGIYVILWCAHNLSNLLLLIINYIFYSELWSVVFSALIAVIWGLHETSPYKSANLIIKCYTYSNCPFGCRSPISPLVLGPLSLRHNNSEIRLINNPLMASKCSSKRKSHMALILNQKLEMIRYVES
jgi:hypothetical protein